MLLAAQPGAGIVFFVVGPAHLDVGVAEFQAVLPGKPLAVAVVPAAHEHLPFAQPRGQLRADGNGFDRIVDDDVIQLQERFQDAGAYLGDTLAECDAPVAVVIDLQVFRVECPFTAHLERSAPGVVKRDFLAVF